MRTLSRVVSYIVLCMGVWAGDTRVVHFGIGLAILSLGTKGGGK